jgi:hypothetical protein
VIYRVVEPAVGRAGRRVVLYHRDLIAVAVTELRRAAFPCGVRKRAITPGGALVRTVVEVAPGGAGVDECLRSSACR